MSGFYGDRFNAAKEMIEGGPIDFLTGDFLAELTMAILHKSQLKKAEYGYAVTFLKQMKDILAPCLDKKIKVVVNAGGLNPKSLAKSLKDLASEAGVRPRIAYITGDNLMPNLETLQKKGASLKHLDTGQSLSSLNKLPVTANAYMGCWGIVKALENNADIVVTGRVADTSVVMGPAAYYFNWSYDNWDALAGAATAGHIIECSGQASGGNYSFIEEVGSYHNLGFPIAEISSDGSSVITKHPNTGGIINIGTVTAQLLYEISEPAYVTPDVIAHFDSVQLTQKAKNRVALSTVKGSPATDTSKVTINCMDGFQNDMTIYIAGLDIEKKVDIFKDQFLHSIGGADVFDEISFDFFPTHKDNPKSNEEALATLRISVKDADPTKAGKLFTSKLIELALCSVPGFCISTAPKSARPRIVHFPALIEKKFIKQFVHLDDEIYEIKEIYGYENKPIEAEQQLLKEENSTSTSYSEIYLGELFAARSGDKGGNANLGVYGKTAQSYAFLHNYLTIEELKKLLPDTSKFDIVRYEFPNLHGLNFYIKGFLGEGVAANNKIDGQAKTLGEYLRAKKIMAPVQLLSV